MIKNCPKQDTKKKIGGNVAPANTGGRVFTLSTTNAKNAPGTVSGTLQLGERSIYVLFDTGPTHSVVSNSFTKYLMIRPIPLDHTLTIFTPMNDSFIITSVYKDCPIRVESVVYNANLYPMYMSDFDVILGIDWLSRHHVTIVFYSRCVIFGDLQRPDFIYHGTPPRKSLMIISALKAQKFLSHGCEGFLAYVKSDSYEEPTIDSHPVVCEYADVFPQELPGLPPDREVEFTIDLIPGAEPISKAPYRWHP
ncbi:uncharacterized protein LOC143630210 [Bidens hawaiensis]|uniref:uncharacterized protein LOC143630210 n=1 Tax=Bidens hawaiensis TaxID=980011 RepID=UPI0040490EC1